MPYERYYRSEPGENLSEDQKERVRRFESEMNRLARELGIGVTGCGCCGSPSLVDLEEGSGTLPTHFEIVWR